MMLCKVKLADIDFSETSFRRYVLPLHDVAGPPFDTVPVLIRTPSLMVALTGRDVLQQAAAAGQHEVSVLCVETATEADALAVSVRLYRAAGAVDDAMRALVIGRLHELTGNAAVSMNPALADALDIQGGRGEIERYLAVYTIDPDATMPFGCALAVAEAPVRFRKTLIALFARIAPNRNTARRIAENLVAVSIREKRTAEQVLAEPEIRDALELAGLAGNERIRKVDDALDRMRFPVLRSAEQKARDLVASLGLPSGVRVELPKNLEGRAKLTVEFAEPATAASTLRELSDAFDSETWSVLRELIAR